MPIHPNAYLPAYPQPIVQNFNGNLITTDEYSDALSGLTMRDRFALSALSALLKPGSMFAVEEIAKQSYRAADAMLAEREKDGAS